MMKTALSIIQSVRYRLNLPAPTTLVSITDPDELQMLHILYAVCEELRQARCWSQLKRTYSFDTVASTSTYHLPADFYAPLLDTYWNEEDSEKLIGPAGDAHYAYLLKSGASSTTDYTWRVFGRDENTASASTTLGGQLKLNPTPSSADTIYIEYLTRSFFLPKNWAASTVFAATTYCNANGNIYYTTAGGTTGATSPSHTTGSTADGAGGVTWTYISTAYETIVADTDLVVFDDDLVKLGIRAKWIEDHGGDYAQAKAEFESKIDQAVARYRGSYVGSTCNRESTPSYAMQYKSWTF